MYQQYILYKGDEIVGKGTAKELAEERNVKVETIKWYSTPSATRRGKNSLVAVRV